MLQAVIIEDEVDAVHLLSNIIQEYCPDIEIIGNADTIGRAKDMIHDLNPDVVFLDIQLKDGNGFDVLDTLDSTHFHVIFITAYDSFAIKAFKYDAIDYILKPYSPNDVRKAIEKVSKRNKLKLDYDELRQKFGQGIRVEKEILRFSTQDGVVLLPIKDIVRVEADRAYSKIFLRDERVEYISKPLKEVATMLPSHFIKTHMSHVINMNFLDKFSYRKNGEALLVNGVAVPVSRRKRKEFLDALSNIVDNSNQ